MNIIKNELKKIFNIKSLLVLLAISFVIYKIFISFYIDSFPSGRPPADIYNIAKRIVEEKGINISDVELDYFLDLKQEYEDESDNYLKENQVAKELGVENVEQLKEVMINNHKNDSNESYRKADELYNNIMFEEEVDSFWKLQEIDYFIESYERNNRSDNSLSGKQKERINEVISRKSYSDVIPELVLQNYNGFIFNSTALIVISVIFMIAPIFTKDKHRNLEQIQYTTKRGRKLYRDKIITSLIGSVIIVTVELGVLFSIYLTRENTVEMFYNASINSWLNVLFNWFDLTFKEYIFVTIILIYVFSLCLSLFISFISRKCSRYITLIGISLLLTIALFKLVTMEFLLWGGFGWNYKPKFLIIGFLSIMAILGVFLVLIQNKNEKKRSILN